MMSRKPKSFASSIILPSNFFVAYRCMTISLNSILVLPDQCSYLFRLGANGKKDKAGTNPAVYFAQVLLRFRTGPGTGHPYHVKKIPRTNRSLKNSPGHHISTALPDS